MGQTYWVIKDTRKDTVILSGMSPTDWTSGIPVDYEYLIKVRYMGDHSWMELNE